MLEMLFAGKGVLLSGLVAYTVQWSVLYLSRSLSLFFSLSHFISLITTACFSSHCIISLQHHRATVIIPSLFPSSVFPFTNTQTVQQAKLVKML